MENTSNIDLDNILKGELTEGLDIYSEASSGKKPIPVEKKLAGLLNLGKTFFTNEAELAEKHNWAWYQVVQKYGEDICGGSAQLQTQRANTSSVGDNDGTGTGTGSKSELSGSPQFKSESQSMQGRGGLIECSVSPLMQIPHEEVDEASSKAWEKVKKAWENLKSGVRVKMGSDNKFKTANEAAWNTIQKQFSQLRPASGAKDYENIKAWKAMVAEFEKGTWKKNFKSDLRGLSDAWSDWEKECGVTTPAGGVSDVGSKSTPASTSTDKLDGNDKAWNPYQTYRIDVKTNFDDTWFKRKFKSGFLNKMIFAIKTDIRSRSPKDSIGTMAGHKYTADEMLPADKRKLDSIQWKMTNKVAKDYITFLMGWSRKKELYKETNPPEPVDKKLKKDEGFGKTMADKALGNRGILGRLKQKIFSGGQSNNVISVAFMMADPNDGWNEIEPDKNPEDGSEGGSSGSESKGGGSSSGSGGSSGSTGSSGKGGAGGGAFGSPSSSPELYAPLTSEQAQETPKDAAKNLAARVKRLEDEVGITPPTSESTDPFEEAFMEERMELVKEVCEGKADVQVLIEHCLTNDWGN